MAPEDDIVFKLERIGSAVAPSKGIRIQDIREILAWEKSRHLATLPLVFLPNDVWETRAEIPYWWRLGSASDWLNQISHAARPIRSTSKICVVTRHQFLNFLRSFLGRHLAGKPVVASPNVGCFLRLSRITHLSKEKKNDGMQRSTQPVNKTDWFLCRISNIKEML